MSKAIEDLENMAKEMTPVTDRVQENVTQQLSESVTDRSQKSVNDPGAKGVTDQDAKPKIIKVTKFIQPEEMQIKPVSELSTPFTPQNIKIEEQHPLTNDVDKLLKEGEVSEAITSGEYRSLYTYLMESSTIHQAQVIDVLSKKLKLPKNAIKQDFKDYVAEIRSKRVARAKALQLSRYKKIFNVLEDIEMPEDYAIKDQFLEYLSGEKTNIISKVFTISNKVLAKDRAYFEIKKVENNYSKAIMVAARDLTDSKKIAQIFADTGEVFDPAKASLVTKFISEYTRLNEDQIPTKIGRTTTGWDNGIFYLPQLSNDCMWIDQPSQLDKSFVTKGSLNGSVELIRELGRGKAMLVSLAGLASSLYDVIDTLNLNFTIHIGGLRGEGKSLAIKSAVSLYGVPNVAEYGRNWNATLSGIETYVERFKSVPAWCDELEAARSTADVITFMYAFSEGAGRARAMVKDGDVVDREIKTFKGILFSTGEKNIDEIIQNMGKERNIPLGVTRRVLDLKVEQLWKGIDREKVGDLLDEHYGVFASHWIKIISENKELIEEKFKELRRTLNWKLDGKEKLFYLMITVLRFLRSHNIIDDSIYHLQIHNIKELAENERLDMIKNKDIGSAFVEHASNFIAQNANYFISEEFMGSADMPNTIYGRIKENEIAITAKVFKDICIQNGLVQAQVIDAIKRDKYLITSNDGTPSKLVKLYKGITTRCYVLKKHVLSPEEEKELQQDETLFQGVPVIIED